MFHMTGGGEANWAEFADAIFAEAHVARPRCGAGRPDHHRANIRRRRAGPPTRGSTAAADARTTASSLPLWRDSLQTSSSGCWSPET